MSDNFAVVADDRKSRERGFAGSLQILQSYPRKLGRTSGCSKQEIGLDKAEIAVMLMRSPLACLVTRGVVSDPAGACTMQ